VVDAVTFATIVVGLFDRETPQDPLIVTYNVDAFGTVRTSTERESGRTGDRWQRVIQHLFTTKVDPAFTEYIRTGSLPPGTHPDVVKQFNSVKAELDTIRASGVEVSPPPDFGGSDTPEDFRPIIRPTPGSPLPGDPGDFEDDGFGKLYGGPHETPIGVEDFFVPRFVRSIPGGAAGFAQQTPAGQRQMFGGTVGGTRSRPRKLSRRSAGTAHGQASRYRKTFRSRARKARGSRKPRPGTKAWMTYIRGLRRKG
jgi:hypothetical protein